VLNRGGRAERCEFETWNRISRLFHRDFCCVNLGCRCKSRFPSRELLAFGRVLSKTLSANSRRRADEPGLFDARRISQPLCRRFPEQTRASQARDCDFKRVCATHTERGFLPCRVRKTPNRRWRGC
jgi:hypothetical protein